MARSTASDRSGGGRKRAVPRSPRAVKQRLESLADAGVLDLPRAKPGLDDPEETPTADSASLPARAMPPASVSPKAPAKRGAKVSDAASRVAALEILRTEVAGCRACVHLAEARTNTVFGSGNPAARLCFLGEAPGADEDASGEPFVGRAGQLLTKIIEACTLTRDEVYILNVLKCRPPENRRPEPEEVANCRGYFERQIEAIRPEFICCLGTSAAQSLLRTDETIGKLRGRWFDYGPATVICTYHPSYLLRNPAAKRDVWDDMQHLMARMGIEMPHKGPGG
jgi:uracil-DNA glycosylase family 4